MPSICKQPQSLFRDAYLCLFLPFSTGLRVQMKVEQSPGVLTLQEGRNSFLICNYSTSMTSIQWFQQNPDGRLIFLFYVASGMQQKGRLKSTSLARSITVNSTSETPSLRTQPLTSVLWMHSALQTPEACTQNQSWGPNPLSGSRCPMGLELKSHCLASPDSCRKHFCRTTTWHCRVGT